MYLTSFVVSSVASFAEAWIEIKRLHPLKEHPQKVASFAEAWIEITCRPVSSDNEDVASFAEAWIEIQCACIDRAKVFCRLLRGGVD